ncbi:MAG: DNA repair protein RecO [Ruminococcaceae bacterium]|nr:DNA repair protein RecO [Oscillospiraceae bacterium]
MSEQCHTMGLVIRAKREKDVILTLLTPEMGKLTVIAKGAKSLKGPQMALSQPFCYGDFELYKKGDLYWLRTGELKENFYGVTSRLDALNLAAYFCDVAIAVSEPGEPCEELLRLLLNSLYFLANKTYPDELIKGVFEWRILAMQGLSPAVNRCCGCGKTQDGGFALDIAQGDLFCGECRANREVFGDAVRTDDDAPRHEWVLLTQGALEAIRFAISTPLGKMMSFRLDDETDRYDFSRAGEKFVRYHLDVDSAALRMYEQMRGK